MSGSDRYTNSFRAFINGNQIEENITPNSSNANEIMLSIIVSINSDDEPTFGEAYKTLSSRDPDDKSDWIRNDFLIYSALIGILFFDYPRDWIKKVVKVRISATSSHKKILSHGLHKILESDLENSAKNTPLKLVTSDILDINNVSDKELNECYGKLSKSEDFHEDSFYEIVYTRARELLFLTKGIIGKQPSKHLKEFKDRFESISYYLSILFWFTSLLITSVAWIYIIYNYALSPDTLGKLISALGFLGLGGLPLTILVKYSTIVRKSQNTLYRLFRYNKEEIDKLT